MRDHHSYTKPFSLSMIVKSFSTLLEYNKSLIFILDLPLFSFIHFSLSSFLSSHSFCSPFSLYILLPLVTFTFFPITPIIFFYRPLHLDNGFHVDLKKTKQKKTHHYSISILLIFHHCINSSSYFRPLSSIFICCFLFSRQVIMSVLSPDWN